MAFPANPLSLSVPEAAFETWLRDSGYLEVIDERATAAGDPSAPPPSDLSRPAGSGRGDDAGGSASAVAGDRDGSRRSSSLTGIFLSFHRFVRTLVSLLTLNPFAKLAAGDFSPPTPSWTLEFIGSGLYSWPTGPSQGRMRVQENVRRYARNYASLWCLVFACSLYKMPIALLGLVSSLFLWELVRFCSTKWELEEKHPALRQALVLIFQLASSVILYLCNLQLVVICATGVSYAVMIFHASLRKLTPSKHSNKQRKFQQKSQLSLNK